MQVAATMGMTADEINNGSEEYKKLEQAAKDMGATTMFSASQSAEALNYLALAGYDAEEAIATLPTILNVAAAGGMELADASDLVTDAMSALGDKAGTVEEFGDMLAKTSQKSNTSVSQLGDAILTVGGTAKNLSGGMAEASTAIGILSDNGIKASEAGTALRNVILNLAHPRNNAAAATMDNLGISAWDAEGNMRPLNEVLVDLNVAMADMSSHEKSSIISTIFNKVDLKSVNALLANVTINTDKVSESLNKMGYNSDELKDNINRLAAGFTENADKATFVDVAISELGVSFDQANELYGVFTESLADGSRWDELNGHILDSKDAAANMSETMQNNLNGAMTSLGSAIEGVQIVIGNYFIPIIRECAERLKDFASWFTNASPAVQNLAVGIGVFVAALGPALVMLGTMISSLGTVVSAFSAFSGAIATAGGLGPWFATAIAPIVTAIGGVIAIVVTVTMSIKENWEGIKKATQDLVNKCSPQFEQFKNAFKGLWDTCKSIYDTVIKPLFKIIGEVIETCIRASTPILQSLLTVFTVVFNTINTIWNNVGRPVFKFIISVVKEVWAAFKPVFDNISRLFSSVATGISNVYSSLIAPAFNAFLTIVNKLGSVVSPVFKTIKTVVTGALNAMLSPINAVVKGFEKIISTVGKVAKSVGGTLGKVFKRQSMDINANVVTAQTFETTPLENVALSGSYYARGSNLLDSFNKLANVTNGIVSSRNGSRTGELSINNNLDTTRLESLMANMINILQIQNDLIKNDNKSISVDGREIARAIAPYSGEIDKYSTRNPRFSY